MDKNKIIPYIEPIFHFCCRRLENRYDAEDLSSEIICYILDGLEKYKIESFDAWVWRIAHNRYARFLEARRKNPAVLEGDNVFIDIAAADCYFADEKITEHRFETVFRYLHTLSAEYRDIFIDYYIGEMSVRKLAEKYSLPESTIKWRLNAGRQKIKNRIGENCMDKVYNRIHWNTACCNGSINSERYLNTQVARAICQAAYEKPLTVEEISISTGIPALYIEDELPRLEYGDAVCKIGKKYAANFIIFRLQDKKAVQAVSASLIGKIADMLEELFCSRDSFVKELAFYGHDFGMDRLGHILVPYILRKKIGALKDERLNLASEPYPPRKDGGYGWFIVEETADENENSGEYTVGCNIAGNENSRRDTAPAYIYYYWISKYFDNEIYQNRGTHWLCASGVLSNSKDGIIKEDSLTQEDMAMLIRNNLFVKSDDNYKVNFACFTWEQFAEFTALFEIQDESLEDSLMEWILAVRKSFEQFVPARLADQINQWVSGYLFQIIGYVTDELIGRGVLKKPKADMPFTDGVFYVEGKYIEP